MIKAGLIGAVIGFIYVTSLTLVSFFCTFCITPLLGLSAGYLAARFDQPPAAAGSLSKGSIAGGITGAGVVVGQMLASIINAILITNSEQWPTLMEQLPILMEQFGASEFFIANTNEYWQATLTLNAFFSMLNLIILIGLGAVGGLIWFQRQNRNTLSAASP